MIRELDAEMSTPEQKYINRPDKSARGVLPPALIPSGQLDLRRSHRPESRKPDESGRVLPTPTPRISLGDPGKAATQWIASQSQFLMCWGSTSFHIAPLRPRALAHIWEDEAPWKIVLRSSG